MNRSSVDANNWYSSMNGSNKVNTFSEEIKNSMSPDVPLFPRSKKFRPELRKWREHCVSFLQKNHIYFENISEYKSKKGVRELLDKDIEIIMVVSRILSLIYGDPDHGNPIDPLDNLIYILLSRRTRESGYQKAYSDLKAKYSNWRKAADAKDDDLLKVIGSSGMATHKVAGLRGIFERTLDEFGEITLEPLKSWPDGKIENFLVSLPHVDRKSALCVMMYSLRRKVFPADANVNRIILRASLFTRVGFLPSKTNHRLNQKILAELIPVIIRFSFHVNLVAHGRECCTPSLSTLKCLSCEIRKFCQTFRKSCQAQTKKTNGPVFIDVFSGAGGMSEGFKRAGFRPMAAVEKDPSAAMTYWLNHPEIPDNRLYSEDIEKSIPKILKNLGEIRIDALIGGPPCQSYSRVGYRTNPKYRHLLEKDDRRKLFIYMVELARELRPILILLENVPAIGDKYGDKQSDLEIICNAFIEIGYRPQVIRFNAAEVWVPQNRIRTFIVATIDDRPVPKPTRTCINPMKNDSRQLKLFPEGFVKPVTLYEAIGDLPEIPANSEVWIRKKDETGGKKTQNRYLDLKGIGNRTELIYNHVTRYHNESDLELYCLLKPGETAKDAIEKYKRPDLMKYKTTSFEDKYRKLEPDKPSYTIVAHLRKDGNSFIHPFQTRDLSVREAARLQSFSDEYIFTGSRGDQYEQIGNAVPPLMAEAIARTFLTSLKDRRG